MADTNELTQEQIAARLQELQDKRAARAEAVKQAASSRAAQLRSLELAEAIEVATTEHGPEGTHIIVVDTETELGSVIMKRPAKARYRAFQNAKKSKDEDLESLVRSCIVYPDADRVDRILDDLPGMLLTLAKVMARLAGHRQEELESK